MLQELLVCMYKHGIQGKKTFQSQTGHKSVQALKFMSGLVLSNIERHVKPWQTSLTHLQKSK